MSKSFDGMVYTKTAASKISGRIAVEVRIWAHVCFVRFEKGSPRFMSKKAFRAEFAASRQHAGRQIVQQGLITYSGSDTFFALSSTNSIYPVQLHEKHVSCMCRDWERQKEAGIPTPTCKHGYAALGLLGFSRLSDYTQSRKYAMR